MRHMKDKHTQIRPGIFESNSSSTHAYTLTFTEGRLPSYKPIVSGPIRVCNGALTDGRWIDNISLLAGYLYIKGGDRLKWLETVLGDFCEKKVEFDFSDFKSAYYLDWSKELELDEKLEAYFENFSLGNYVGYGNDYKECVELVEKILSSKENVISFVSNSNWIEVDAYYDG